MEEVERFLQHDMEPQERTAFEARMKEDAEFKNLVDEMKLLFVGIQETSLNKNLAIFHDGLNTEKKPAVKGGTIFKLNTRLMVAASLFIIVSVATWLLLTSKNQYEKLYSSYYKPDPGLLTAMGSSDNYAFEKGMVEYKNEEYKKAIQSWEPLLARDPGNDTLHYFLGAANQALGNDDIAKKHLDIIVKDSANSFYSDARWYLGILFLKQGEIQQAKTFIEKSNHSRKEELLNAINLR